MDRPNIVFLFPDQMRAHAMAVSGDANVRTPYLDGLAEESVSFSNAVSNCPICTPYRASMLTGQYPLTNGVFMNDVYLPESVDSFAHVLGRAGYDTAYIGKWHVDGHGRSSYIPRERRQGFDYWKVLECTHQYNDSPYYSGDDPRVVRWDGYDAYAQTDDALAYLGSRGKGDPPFALFVSWGPPHGPYKTAPPDLIGSYEARQLELRPNVPPELQEDAREELTGYYAHITALDRCVQRIDAALTETGMRENTILVFTSDHGDCVRSHCTSEAPRVNKQMPYEESILVPFFLRWPQGLGRGNRVVETPICSPDIMPTILGLAGVPIPQSVEGIDFAPLLRGENTVDRTGVLIAAYSPFSVYGLDAGGREYRGIRTERYTYVRDLNGPWLLFDNVEDPYQMTNLVGQDLRGGDQEKLNRLLDETLSDQGDDFLPAAALRDLHGYPAVDSTGCVPYTTNYATSVPDRKCSLPCGERVEIQRNPD